MKSGNKIKMSSGNSTRCVGEVNENLSLRSPGTTSTFWLRYFILIINAVRFCKLYTVTAILLLVSADNCYCVSTDAVWHESQDS